MKKVKYTGHNPVKLIINGETRKVYSGDVVDVPGNFNSPIFEIVKAKKQEIKEDL